MLAISLWLGSIPLSQNAIRKSSLFEIDHKFKMGTKTFQLSRKKSNCHWLQIAFLCFFIARNPRSVIQNRQGYFLVHQFQAPKYLENHWHFGMWSCHPSPPTRIIFRGPGTWIHIGKLHQKMGSTVESYRKSVRKSIIFNHVQWIFMDISYYELTFRCFFVHEQFV